jgi:hypothetical protein
MRADLSQTALTAIGAATHLIRLVQEADAASVIILHRTPIGHMGIMGTSATEEGMVQCLADAIKTSQQMRRAVEAALARVAVEEVAG